MPGSRVCAGDARSDPHRLDRALAFEVVITLGELDRLNKLTDKIYVHIDMDVLDPREVMGHGNKVPNGPSSEQLARLFEEIDRRVVERFSEGSLQSRRV